MLDRSVMRKLQQLNALPDTAVDIDTYFRYQKEALMNLAETDPPIVNNTVDIEKYLSSANILLQQAKVHSEGGIWGPITDKQVSFIFTCRYYLLVSKLLDHPGFQKLER